MVVGSPTSSGPITPNSVTPATSAMPVTSHGVRVGRNLRMPPFDARRVAIDVVLSASSVSAPMVGLGLLLDVGHGRLLP